MSPQRWYQKKVLSRDELKQWYTLFLEVEHEYQIVRLSEDGGIDYQEAETRVTALVPQIRVTGDFCEKCDSIIKNWPGHAPNEELDPTSRDPVQGATLPRGAEIISGKGGALTLPYHDNIDFLEASGRAGCKLCRLFLQAVRERDLLHVFRVIESRLGELDKPTSLTLLVNLPRSRKISNLGHEQLWLLFPEKSNSVALRPVSVSIYDLSRRVSSLRTAHAGSAAVQDAVKLAKDWLYSCQQNHDLCNGTADAPVPTRLLRMSNDSDQVGLVHTAGMQVKPQYATLSHCWGNDNSTSIRLTRDSMRMFVEGIAANTLSKTFQDAIKIALGVGLTYLWIDSLCIIQGDRIDWEAEASKMASVYGASSLNIAASSALDGSQGCFLRSDNAFGGFEAALGHGAHQTPSQFRTPDAYRKAVLDSHLVSRAWALQEKVLPVRTLHCGDQGFFWECRSVVASEFLPSGFVLLFMGHQFLVCDPLDMKTLPGIWPRLRNMYSQCRLTFPSDKLVALSAIAQQVQNINKDKYLAGLWSNQLEEQLCWSICGAQPRPPYRAPSWSWASVDGPLWTPTLFDRIYVNVKDVRVDLSGLDPLGAVSGGKLTLRYSLMAKGVVSSVRIRGRTQQSWEIPFKSLAESFAVEDSKYLEHSFYVRPDSMDSNDYIPEEPLFLLPIMGGKSGNKFSRTASNGVTTNIDNMSIAGLALQVFDHSKRVYIRVGLFGFNLTSSGDDYHPFMTILKATGGAVAESACSATIKTPNHADEKYLITIV